MVPFLLRNISRIMTDWLTDWLMRLDCCLCNKVWLALCNYKVIKSLVLGSRLSCLKGLFIMISFWNNFQWNSLFTVKFTFSVHLTSLHLIHILYKFTDTLYINEHTNLIAQWYDIKINHLEIFGPLFIWDQISKKKKNFLKNIFQSKNILLWIS